MLLESGEPISVRIRVREDIPGTGLDIAGLSIEEPIPPDILFMPIELDIPPVGLGIMPVLFIVFGIIPVLFIVFDIIPMLEGMDVLFDIIPVLLIVFGIMLVLFIVFDIIPVLGGIDVLFGIIPVLLIVFGIMPALFIVVDIIPVLFIVFDIIPVLEGIDVLFDIIPTLAIEFVIIPVLFDIIPELDMSPVFIVFIGIGLIFKPGARKTLARQFGNNLNIPAILELFGMSPVLFIEFITNEFGIIGLLSVLFGMLIVFDTIPVFIVFGITPSEN